VVDSYCAASIAAQQLLFNINSLLIFRISRRVQREPHKSEIAAKKIESIPIFVFYRGRVTKTHGFEKFYFKIDFCRCSMRADGGSMKRQILDKKKPLSGGKEVSEWVTHKVSIVLAK